MDLSALIRFMAGIFLCLPILLWSQGAFRGAGGPYAAENREQMEAEFLYRYAFLICAMASYGQLDPPPLRIVALLRDEAWFYVEKGSVGAEAYRALHPLSVAAGKAVPPRAAMRGCMAWPGSEKVRRLVAGFVGRQRK